MQRLKEKEREREGGRSGGDHFDGVLTSERPSRSRDLLNTIELCDWPVRCVELEPPHDIALLRLGIVPTFFELQVSI